MHAQNNSNNINNDYNNNNYLGTRSLTHFYSFLEPEELFLPWAVI